MLMIVRHQFSISRKELQAFLGPRGIRTGKYFFSGGKFPIGDPVTTDKISQGGRWLYIIQEHENDFIKYNKSGSQQVVRTGLLLTTEYQTRQRRPAQRKDTGNRSGI
jgi:hypothetical protein